MIHILKSCFSAQLPPPNPTNSFPVCAVFLAATIGKETTFPVNLHSLTVHDKSPTYLLTQMSHFHVAFSQSSIIGPSLFMYVCITYIMSNTFYITFTLNVIVLQVLSPSAVDACRVVGQSLRNALCWCHSSGGVYKFLYSRTDPESLCLGPVHHQQMYFVV